MRKIIVALLLVGCSAANASTPSVGKGVSPMGNRVANFVCRPSNTPTENGTNVCGQTTAVTQTRDCTFNDLLETGSGGYSKGAPGLSVIGYNTATSTNVQWTIIWVNATNQPIQGFGNKVYADMYCHNPEGHNLLETQGLKQ